jgi:hypothetical protein
VKEFLLLFAGWMLGMVQPLLLEPFLTRRRRAEVLAALRQELREFRHRMAFMCHSLTLRYGEYDRAFLEWFYFVVQDHKGYMEREGQPERIAKILAEPPEQLALYAASKRTPDSPGVNSPTVELPYLEHAIEELHLFAPEIQAVLPRARTPAPPGWPTGTPRQRRHRWRRDARWRSRPRSDLARWW